MKSIFVLTYHWIDMPDSQHVRELFDSADRAETERDRLVVEENERKQFDPASKGKLEIRIDRYNFDKNFSTVNV